MPDTTDTTPGFETLFTPGGVHELRIPDAGRYRTISGYFDAPEKLAAAAIKHNSHGGVYFTLNPCNPALLARSCNTTAPYAKHTTSDADIMSRWWFFIDLDPDRPAGIPSTDAEHAAALNRGRQIADYLTERGWPEPVFMDSGNGAYLLYRIDEPNDAAALARINGCLKALAAQFNDIPIDGHTIKVDTTGGNASRIVRVPATTNRKGSGSPDRQHRPALILSTPTTLDVVDTTLLDALAGETAEAETPNGSSPGAFASGATTEFFTGAFNLEAFIKRHFPDAVGPKNQKGAEFWGLPVCPFNPEHNRREAFIGRLSSGALTAGCHHDSCTWGWSDLRDHYEPRQAAPSSTRSGGGTVIEGQTLATDDNPDGEVLTDARRYFDRAGLRARTLLTDCERVGPLASGIDGKVWAYEDGVWVHGDRILRSRVVALLGERYRRAHADTVESMVQSREPFINDTPVTNYLNVPNGLLDWRTGRLHPHSEKIPSTTRIPVLWNPDAECPNINKFLKSVVDPECVPILEEIAGYALYPDQPLHKAVMLDGTGRNGKGVYLRILAALIGAPNIAATPPQRLDTDRWAVAQLYGKLANLVGDVDPRTFKETATFKQATGQDMLQGEHKYAAPFTFTSRALIVAAFNSLPRSVDTTEGFFSRWLVIPFPNRFVDPDRDGTVPAGCLAKDPELAGKVTSPAELEGFLVQAVTGLRRVMDRGAFSRAEAVTQAETEFRRHADPVRGFLAEAVTADPDGKISRAQLHAAFKMWAADSGIGALSAKRFAEKVREVHLEMFGHTAVEVKRAGVRGWAGIRLRTAADEPDEPEPDEPDEPDEPEPEEPKEPEKPEEPEEPKEPDGRHQAPADEPDEGHKGHKGHLPLLSPPHTREKGRGRAPCAPSAPNGSACAVCGQEMCAPASIARGQCERCHLNARTQESREKPVCPACGRAPARTDTGLCDLCTVKAERTGGAA